MLLSESEAALYLSDRRKDSRYEPKRKLEASIKITHKQPAKVLEFHTGEDNAKSE